VDECEALVGGAPTTWVGRCKFKPVLKVHFLPLAKGETPSLFTQTERPEVSGRPAGLAGHCCQV